VYCALCLQINDSKLCILRQISKENLKAAKKLYICRLKTVCKLNVPGLCTLNIFCYEISLSCGTFQNPLLGHGNTFNRGLPVGRRHSRCFSSYAIDVSHLYFNILCLLLLEVSISVDLHLPYITIFPL
jgi:hypothetical protein